MMIEVTRYFGTHRGGTKEYELIRLQQKGSYGGLLFRRWSGVGKLGQCKVEGSANRIEAVCEKAVSERLSAGYDMTGTGTFSHQTVAQALSLIDPKHRIAFTNAQLNRIDPGSYSVGDGSFYNELSGPSSQVVQNLKDADREEQAQKDAQELLAMQSNPLFGMF